MGALKKDWYKAAAKDAEYLAKITADRNEFVYFIRAVGTNFVKIGRSCAPKKRLASLQVDSPRELRLIGCFPNVGEFSERRLHERFRSSRERGEWFRADTDLCTFLAFQRASLRHWKHKAVSS